MANVPLFSQQKIGFVSSVALLSEIPEVAQVNADLEVLQKQLLSKREKMVGAFQKSYEDLQSKEKLGQLSPIQLEDGSKKLKEEEQEIVKFENEIQNKLATQQQTLMQPILDKLNKAITQVAQEQGYTFIFEESSGIFKFKDEAFDITAMVKDKLGL